MFCLIPVGKMMVKYWIVMSVNTEKRHVHAVNINVWISDLKDQGRKRSLFTITQHFAIKFQAQKWATTAWCTTANNYSKLFPVEFKNTSRTYL